MGIYDRDYYRPQPKWGGSFGFPQGSFITPLVWALGSVFLLQVLTSPRDPFTNWLALDPSRVQAGEVWRLLTYGLVHDIRDPLHILMNGLVIWFFGKMLELELRPAKIAQIFLSSVLVGGLVFCAISWLGFRPGAAISLGASGGATALLVTAAWRHPKQPILLFFLFSIPLWAAAILFVSLDLFLFFQGGSRIAVEIHLSGALVATLWEWSNRADYFQSGIFQQWKRSILGPKLKVFRDDIQQTVRTKDASSKAQRVKNAQSSAPAKTIKVQEQEMDRILEKISSMGMQSLSDEEKKFLISESARLKNERGR